MIRVFPGTRRRASPKKSQALNLLLRTDELTILLRCARTVIRNVALTFDIAPRLVVPRAREAYIRFGLEVDTKEALAGPLTARGPRVND